MSRRGRGSGGVSEQDTRSDHAHEHAAPDGTCAARMTSVNVSQRMHELSDGMMRLFSATKAGRKRFILGIPVKDV